MKMLTYGETSLAALRSPRFRAGEYPPVRFERLPGDCIASSRLLGSIDLAGFDLNDRPVHLMTPRHPCSRESGGVVGHTCSAALSGITFVQVASGVYVGGPALCLVQLAASRPLPEVLEVAYEFCGGYAMDRRLPRGFRRVQTPLISAAELARQLADFPPMRGLSRARLAARLVSDGAWSPMEAVLAMLLSLPHRYGGAAIKGIELNRRVALSPEAARLYGKATCVCDIYVSGLDIEYNGRADHDGAANERRDRLRSDALAMMGVTVITVRSSQVYEQRELNNLIRGLERALGRPHRRRVADFEDRQRQLMGLLPKVLHE